MKKKGIVLVAVVMVSLIGVSSVSAVLLCSPSPPIISPAVMFGPMSQKLLEKANSLIEQAEERDIDIPEEIYEMMEEAETTGNALYAKTLLNDIISDLEALLG
jgi:hypothetical protein